MTNEILVYDSESDGFVYESTKVHVISMVSALPGEDKMSSYYGNNLEEGLQRLSDAGTIIAHNQIKHDILLFQKHYPGWMPPLVIDTLTLSALLAPERLGGHGIEAWARRMGKEQKVAYEDWDTFDMDMLERCESDVRLNKKVYFRLLKEAYSPIEGVDIYNFDFGQEAHCE